MIIVSARVFHNLIHKSQTGRIKLKADDASAQLIQNGAALEPPS
jgi:hypothetical protein